MPAKTQQFSEELYSISLDIGEIFTQLLEECGNEKPIAALEEKEIHFLM